MKTEDLIKQAFRKPEGPVTAYSAYTIENVRKDPDRQTGRTTKQMESAPLDAIFVWCNGPLAYPRHLAEKVGRRDLKIEGAAFFDIRTQRWQAVTRPIVVDHDAVRTFDKMQFAGYQVFLGRPVPPRAAAIAGDSR